MRRWCVMVCGEGACQQVVVLGLCSGCVCVQMRQPVCLHAQLPYLCPIAKVRDTAEDSSRPRLLASLLSASVSLGEAEHAMCPDFRVWALKGACVLLNGLREQTCVFGVQICDNIFR